jgi:hypothetical protein
MTSALYPAWKEALLQASSNSALTGTVKAILVDTGTYTYNSAHDFLNDITGIAQSGGSNATITIDNKSYTSGRFDTSDDTDTFTSVTAGNSVEALIIYIDTGTSSTSRLVAYIDGFASVTPNGGDITVDWSDIGDGFDGIFQL